MKQNPSWGTWMISCPEHGFLESKVFSHRFFSVPVMGKNTLANAINDWFLGLFDNHAV
jgi:hypothetical protein